jgi:phosphatidylserine decarboxylase
MEDIIKFLIPRISKEGYPILMVAGILTLAVWLFFDNWAFIPLLGLIFSIYFFRDPVRFTPVTPHLIISPADGIVSAIDRNIDYPEELGSNKKGTRISIFLNVFNVHVNRMPISGIITKSSYRPGKFINASLDKASVDNERQSLLITTPEGDELALVQIAGLIARRIVCNAKEGDQLEVGSRYGIIRFGSRVDLYLPEGIEPKVLVGQTTIGGETVLANLEGAQVTVNSRAE